MSFSATPPGRFRCALALLGVCLLPLSAAGQVLYGRITGTVTDSSGAAMPGATVMVTHKETNLAREAVSNETGIYTFTNVQAGTYDVKVSMTGFREFVKTVVPVSVNQISRVDVKLDVGALAETITVAVRGGTAPDRQGRCPHGAEVGGDHGASAQPVPQLPGAHQPGARRHAGRVPECRDGHADAFALDQRQRPEPQQQRDAHRRRHEPQHLAASPQRLRVAGRDDRHRQHLDQQLRRRTGDGGGRGRHRHHQVGNEPVQGLGVRVLQQRQAERDAVFLRERPGASRPSCRSSATSTAARSADRS